jgi:hypothetical protein
MICLFVQHISEGSRYNLVHKFRCYLIYFQVFLFQISLYCVGGFEECTCVCVLTALVMIRISFAKYMNVAIFYTKLSLVWFLFIPNYACGKIMIVWYGFYVL